MKKYVLFFIVMIACYSQSNAQFRYSVNIGWDWPNIHKDESCEKEYSSFTFGANVDYILNPYLALQSGLRYRYVGEDEYPGLSGGSYPIERNHSSFLEIPLLVTACTVKNPKQWAVAWGVGPYINMPIEKNRHTRARCEKVKTYYGLMVTAQLDVCSHYFLRGEYQWGLSSDLEVEGFGYGDKRRITRFSFVLGYRF